MPVDLRLADVGRAFEPLTPIARVHIPKRLSEGVTLPDSGLSLTPADSRGAPLQGAEGEISGVSVLYANTQTDTDTVVKPTTLGVELSTLLRSSDSPRQLFFRLGLPAGASLRREAPSSPFQVVKEGQVIAMIAPPRAEDAEGVDVPVTMSVSGDLLALAVQLSPGEYQYPIDVDPTVTDTSESFNPGDWLFFTDDATSFGGNYEVVEGIRESKPYKYSGLVIGYRGGTYYTGDYGFFSYTTQGASRIYAFVASSVEESAYARGYVAPQYELRFGNGTVESGNGEEGKAEISFYQTGFHEHSGITVCAESACGPMPVSGSEQNAAYFEGKGIAEAGTGFFKFALTSSSVEINQEKAPTASFDTADATIEGVPNALLAGKWYKGSSVAAFGLDARDPGIGVESQGLSSPSKAGWGYPLRNEARNECQGVQCNQCYEPACAGKASGNGKLLQWGLSGASGGELPEGEDTVEAKVEDDVGLSATATAKVKLDNLAPHNITLSGLPSNHELGDGQHFLLKASATDGTSGTPSSGIASIVLYLDGQQIGGPQGFCSLGPCTGNAEWTLSGENYAAGQHILTVVATDNAGNVATEEFQVVIHHPENVSVGPGSVNPVTGELDLTANDVTISAPGGALTVARSYRSRHLAQGAEGPLGPQWSLSLGPQQSISRVSGGVVLTGSSKDESVSRARAKANSPRPRGTRD